MKAAFHLALPCKSVEDTRQFYINTLGAKVGRSSETWVDINLYGNQLTFTNTGAFKFNFKNYKLSDKILPTFHFGVVVDNDTWKKLYKKLSKNNFDVTTEVTFLENKVGEHLSFFITDPNEYMVEFKSFKNAEEIFEKK
ncbi:VOC family protein [Pontimicrobium sp. MEBiC01747]|jgi:extradiol dioxygenase family protein